MNHLRRALAAALSLAQGASGAGADIVVEREFNAWPFLVERRHPASSAPAAWSAVGPLLFSQPAATPDGREVGGLRPFWVSFSDPKRNEVSDHVLYPLFNSYRDESAFRWSFFELIRRQGPRATAPAPAHEFDQRHEFEVFPFWFEREFADPKLSYRALFPVYGTIRDKLWMERASWTAFPFFFETERRGAVSTYTPWPFVRVTRGSTQGWAVWPLFSTQEKPGVSRATYAPWPLVYRATRQPAADAPAGTPPHEEVGFLPFYTRSTGPGLKSENFLWPFFGYTTATRPVSYQENRYFWPFLVQGRSPEHFINRWAPFYSHSLIEGREKHWYLWPLLRQAEWTSEGIRHTRHQFLYFLFWQEQQRAAGRKESPVAELTHVWPVMSHWDNGAGHRQWQLFSPLEVFFPHNPKVRQIWSPLFAVARHDEPAPGRSRTSLLWSAITWETDAAEGHREFHLGPLLGVTRSGSAARVTLGNGLISFQRPAAGGWRVRWFDFPDRSAGRQPR